MRVAIVPGALGIALICIAFFMSTHADTPIDSPGTAESLSDPAPQAARTEFPGSSPASLPEPEPEPTWFRHVIDGRLVYEGSTPHEEGAPEPDPIQQAADQNPTAADLERAVAGWVDVEVTPLAVGDLVTADELKNAVGWDDLYLSTGGSRSASGTSQTSRSRPRCRR